MCRFAADLIDYEALSSEQKEALVKDLQERRDALQAHLNGVNESLQGVNQALEVVQKKSKQA
jgi:hypothetical protein